MTKRELKRRVSEFNRLSDRAVELFDIYVDNPTNSNDCVFWSAMAMLKREYETLQEAEPKKLHATEYLHNYNDRSMIATRLEVW